MIKPHMIMRSYLLKIEERLCNITFYLYMLSILDVSFRIYII